VAAKHRHQLPKKWSEEWGEIISGVSGGFLLITYGIVFASGFTNQNKRRQQQGIFQRPESETLAYYLVSLVASALMLWFFQRLAFDDPWSLWMRYSIILSLPASIGGAAGRLAV
jgi:putative integral membrane protein (TIGR02587 family)